MSKSQHKRLNIQKGRPMDEGVEMLPYILTSKTAELLKKNGILPDNYIIQDELPRPSDWVDVRDRLPEEDGQYLVIHSDKPSYPITAHCYYVDSNFMEVGIAIETNGKGKKDWIKWYSVGRDLQNPFQLKDQDYTRFNPLIFGKKITRWQPLPTPPERDNG